MRNNFDASLKLVLVHEGGYVDHPSDPGGATNLGITRATLSAYKGRQVSKQEVRRLNVATAAAIYRRDYWDVARLDELPAGLDYCVFDGNVNSGVSRSIKWLQEVIGVKQDGVIGVHTLSAVDDFDGTVVDIIELICARRMRFLKRLKHWDKFGNGWTRRVIGYEVGTQVDDIGVIDRATIMAKNIDDIRQTEVPTPLSRDDGANEKADGDEADVKLRSTAIDAVKNPKVLATLGTVVTSVVSAGSNQGPLSYAIAAVLIIAAFGGVIMLLRR